MIDLGISKLALIGVVALVVIGPEKLPKVARMAGTLYGRAQRYLNEVKSEVSREIELDELRQLQQEVADGAQALEHSIADSLAADPGRGDTALPPRASMSDLERKARDFRRKKLVRNSAIPGWYKQRNGGRSHIMSAAARVRKYRPGARPNASFFQ